MPPKRAAKPFKVPRPISQPTTSNSNVHPSSSSVAGRRDEPIATNAGNRTSPEPSPPAEVKNPADELPKIPSSLLTRILHEHFKHPDTQITKEAMVGVSKYVEIFVREALARADWERSKNGQADGGFLEVEDLEKLAPQLLLDF
ncbi:MAG: hypothetical protein M1828_001290 [Chrysothrix sp. TS-e1954]|nr:MAG: hypothetical protein M1828_001290 [Chrysothrix sp. TS-e1954]